MSIITDRVDRLRSESAKSMLGQQLYTIPHFLDDIFYKFSGEYLLDGTRTLVGDNQFCIQLHYLPTRIVKEEYLLEFNKSVEPMMKQIDNYVINPFLLFINGRFIRWSDITIVSQQLHYYLLITGANDRYYDLIQEYETGVFDVKVIYLPFNVNYTEDGGYVNGNTIFTFNDDGTYSVDDYCQIVIDTKSKYLYIDEWESASDINAFNTEANRTWKLFPENFIIFRDGRLDTITTKKVDGCFLTLMDQNGKIFNTDNLSIKLFYHTRCNPSHDNVNNVLPEALQKYIVKMNNGEEVPQYIHDLLTPFELDYNGGYGAAYESNIAEAAKSIMQYNSDLFNQIYAENTSLEIWHKKGSWLKAHVNAQNYFTIPRRHTRLRDGYIIMLVNGMLYEHYYTHTYETNRFICTIQDINDEDDIELLFFKDVKNDVLDITVNEDDGYTNYSKRYRNDKMYMFHSETNDDYFYFPEDGDQDFEVSYNLEYNEDGDAKIVLDNPFYYGKKMTLAYKNQFRYFRYVFDETSESVDHIVVPLGDKFRYCPDYSKYMVFLNGRYLSTDQYRLILPVRTTTPFYTYDIYLVKKIQPGDILEVFYVPVLINDIVTYQQIETTGDIIVDASKLTYNLNNNLYMVWVNGKKIPRENITNISRNRLKINTDCQSIGTVCITKYIDDVDYLSDLFSSNESLWDSIINAMSVEEICNMMGLDSIVIDDVEEPFFNGSYPITAVMWEVLRDYYMSNSHVDLTGPFIYDYYDETAASILGIEGKDPAGNHVLPAYDANREDTITSIERNWY